MILRATQTADAPGDSTKNGSKRQSGDWEVRPTTKVRRQPLRRKTFGEPTGIPLKKTLLAGLPLGGSSQLVSG